MLTAETLHGKWGIWLYSVQMWYHCTVDHHIRPRIYQTPRAAMLAAEQLWKENRAKAQVRQFDKKSADFPLTE